VVQVVGVSLNQFYRLDLKDMNSQGPNVAHQVQWNAASGPKMKMRQFFANANWAQQIHSVDISTSGAKGGVVFLYKNKPNSQAAEDFPAFVVKYTVAPERMLFAEHLLKTIAGAKIPKSLSVYLDWGDPTCPGMELMALLRDQSKWRFITNPTRGFVLNQDKKDKYEQVFLQTIENDHQVGSYSYLVIMKAFTGAYSLMDPSPFDEWLLAADYKHPVGPGEPDRAKTSTTWQTIVQDGKLNNAVLRTKLLGLMRKCNLAKIILSNAHWTQYLGWILAADTLAGNADRIEETNVGNFFFFDKPSPDPNRKHPIAVIDNDALMPQFSHELHPTIKAGMTPNSASVDQYLRFALETGTELPPPGGIQGLAMQLAPLSNLKRVFTDFDELFSIFFSRIMSREYDDYELLTTLYADDGTLAQRLGMPNVRPGDYRTFSNDINSPEWQAVKANIMHGLVDALEFLQNDPNFYNECEQQYVDLVTYYQDDQDLNFDITAFLARYQYLQQIAINPAQGTFTAPDHNAVVAEVKRRVFDAKPIEPYVAAIFLFGKNQTILTTDEVSKYQDYLATLDTAAQPQHITLPKARFHNWTEAGLVALPAGWDAPNTQGYLKGTGTNNPLKLINDAIQASNAAIVGASLGKKTRTQLIDAGLWILGDEENGLAVRVEDKNGQFDVQWDVYGMRILATNAVLLKYFGMRLDQEATAQNVSLLPFPPLSLVWGVVIPEVRELCMALSEGEAFRWEPKKSAQKAMKTLRNLTGVDLYKLYKT
jgi:hypothetical protein